MFLSERTIVLDACTVDLRTGTVARDGNKERLTQRETDLLTYLVSHPREALSRERLHRDVFAYSDRVQSRAVDVIITRLRNKLEAEPSSPRHIVTILGVGYEFRPRDDGGSAYSTETRADVEGSVPHFLVGQNDGFASPALADDAQAIWKESVDRALAGLSHEERMALEVAAALGEVVDETEWRGACTDLVDVPEGLLETAIRQRLAERRVDGWAFTHPLLRESLLRGAAERGRLATVHAACARMFLALPKDRVDPARVGLHLFGAGDLSGAFAPLLVAARRHLENLEFEEAEPICRRLSSLIEELELPPNDARRGEVSLTGIGAAIGLGRLEEADAEAKRCAEAARRCHWPAHRARALRFRAICLSKRGEVALADAVFEQAQVLAEQVGEAGEVGACLEQRGTLCRWQGDYAASKKLLSKAKALYERRGDALRVADCERELGGTLLAAGDLVGAEASLRSAIGRYDAARHATRRVGALTNLGELYRKRGDFDAAERAFEEATVAMRRVGSYKQVIPLLNLGLVRIRRGNYVAAREALVRATDLAARSLNKNMAAYAHAFLLPCAAALNDWPGFGAHLAAARTLIEETGLVDADVEWCLTMAAEAAAAAGRAREEREVLALVGRQSSR